MSYFYKFVRLRTYALSKVKGKSIALTEALKINLVNSHLYHCLIAALYAEVNPTKRQTHLQMALALAETEHDRSIILRKLKN